MDKGNIKNVFTPDMVISLTLPKLCLKNYKGVHYLAGRFIPESVFKKFNLIRPIFNGRELIKRLI